VTGWSVQYSSSTGTGSFSGNVTNLTGTINPGQYYLVQESSNAAVGAVLPTPDASGGIAMAAGAGKVVLVNSTTGLACNGSSTPCSAAQLAQIVDLVGYGTGTNYFEGSGPTSTIAVTTAAFRKSGGCIDTDSNANDFTVATAAPRNTSSATNTCTVTNNSPSINAPANPITAVLQNAAPFNVSLTGSDDNNAFNWGATAGTGVASVVVNGGQGTSSISYTVTLVNNFTGTATFTASLSDGVNAAVTQPVNIKVNAAAVNNPPTITPPANPIITVEENAPAFNVSLTGSDDNNVFNWSATAGTGVSLVSVTAGQGTNHATFTVTLQGGFSGTATFTASLSDNFNAAVTQAVNITVTPPPPPPNHIVISQVYGGGGNSGATYQNDYVELYNPTGSSVLISGWTLQYQAAGSTGTWSGSQPLGGTIGPGEYFLVSLASGGATGSTLPTANIVGGPASINMSATAGKIALVSNADPLSNCPFALDADLVDLVGYGTTANCKEGSSNAPASSNTTALFRKNDGAWDTDVNGADFVIGAPSPRRTAPIAEIGPFVVLTDPNTNASSAPRDASITVTFSEPVNVSGQWFDITCASTGAHNSATTASTDAGATWVITPNVSFNSGEQCTVTVFAANVADVDTDDSLPNTDTLQPGNKVWSFTTSTGTAPPYTPDVHLTMGNPSDAVVDVNVPNNYLMMKPAYALSYNRDKGTPNWVSWHLETAWYGTLSRVDTFRPDPQVPADWYRVQAFDFFTTGFDRGHMTPNADRDNENRIPVNQETYLMSNMVPQAPDNNQGPWANMENALRALTDAGNELYIVSGPAGVGGTGSNGGLTTTLADGHVTVPAYTWKVVLVLPKESGDDVSRVTASTRTIAVIMPNVQGIRNDDWQSYLTTVDKVEKLTGYDFFSEVPDAIENSIEAGINGTNPPGTEGQSVTTGENTSKAITLTAVSSNNNPLTYTIVSSPSNGTLTGTGANRTYTPAPDFTGTDSFTFRVNDGASTSNTSTVTITVTEINSAPVANADNKSTQEDVTLNFPAGDLTLNDGVGDVNDAGQTLSVRSVTGNGNTHGTAVLNSGQVTYTPDANYHGPASFSYEVCDNGTTGGVPDPKCVTGTVNVTVESVNDGPVAVNDTATTDEDVAVSIDVTGNDQDIDGDGLSVASAGNGSHGTTAIVGNKVVYTPAADLNGSDSFNYTVSDGQGGTATANVTVTINPVNDPPIANADSAITDEDTAVEINVRLNDTDVDGDGLSITNTTNGANGTVAVVNGSAVYTPAENYHGSDNFTYTVSDGHGGSAQGAVSVTINSVNDAPIATNDSATTDEDTPKSIDVVANDTDVDGDTLTLLSVSGATNGSVSIIGGQALFSPDHNYNGTGTFNYTVSDGHGGEASATVTVTINSVNDNPVAGSDSATTDEDNSVVVDVRGNDSDVDGDSITITNVSGASKGTAVSITSGPNAGKVLYTPNLNENGADSFTYTLSDGQGGTATGNVAVTINPVNDAPVADAQSVSANEDAPKSITLSGSDVETTAGNLTYTVTTGPSHGTLTGTGANRTYVSNLNYNGPDSFQFTVTDTGDGASAASTSAPATVSITVNPANDAPVANAGADQTLECAGGLTAVTLDGSASSDLDGDTLSYEWRDGATPLGTGAVLNTSLAFGTHNITLKVTDPSGAFSEDIVSINIADHTAPIIMSNGQAFSLWPVNKKYRTFNVSDLVASASDSCNSGVNLSSVVIEKVTSDEGSISDNDIIIAAGCQSVQLRADRDGNGNGRVYTITFKVSDSTGHTTTLARQVMIPHDQGNGNVAIDSGVAYTVTSSCQ
jgi:DNA/RNA endonuclease G (NUC1)